MPAATIAVSNTTAKSLIALIRAITGHANDDGGCSAVTVRGDDANTGIIYAGDDQVTSSNYGIALNATDSRTWTSGGSLNDIDLLGKFVLASTTSQKINLNWEYS